MNHFTWCDLSTLDLAKATQFYSDAFGWAVASSGARGDDSTIFSAGSREAGAIYTMPEFFQKIRMPSFWMSYVRVDSVSDSAVRAVALGAKCEIEPTPFDESSQFALIRDPSGAGFTLYEGPELGGRDRKHRPGRMIANELHVPDRALVEEFYRSLFGWDAVADRSYPGRYEFRAASGERIAALIEFDEAIKGPKNYWAVVFAVKNLKQTLQVTRDRGGQVLMPFDRDLGYAMLTDDQGAMFCVTES